ncbi:type IV toxin-antitoxin system AbiEi family antitoxin domain-containing protein [Dermatobacter hominis]|uniref:type IV toxin-antitoxin system AbiEi family antitoxin domain-containing protein n=1 Tax=Dermatobacter hominis TaxID=2884263 RepID=UPI001D12AE54|nr:type IV toxin-antitoxin system AbiEi family antitoxin domain-containing protein [Dermatobacter hominis]UDY36153.1 type IV toxin-antitoxin system AbiEi family antitoxin domain-containing protein [Dermatobacter hominis]
MDDTSPDGRLHAWAAAHHGLYRTSDAIAAGLSRRQIRYRLEQGRAEQIGYGLFRVAGAPLTQEQRNLAAAWRTGGVVSHRTAAEVHDLVPRSIHTPHASVTRRRTHSLDDVIVHRSDDLLDTEVMELAGTPVTTPARTLVDVGLLIDELELEKALHRAVHSGRASFDEVWRIYRRVSAQGRNGAGPIGELLRSLGRDSAAAESDLEVELLAALRTYGAPAPVLQHPVTVDGERFRLDLAYPRHKLFLEGDGFGVHGTRDGFELDRHRQDLLVLHGWWPLRFTWRQIRRSPEWCATTVVRKLVEIERTWS